MNIKISCMSRPALQEHGCCPDGVTKAKGTNFKGCKNATPCKDAKWGCCEGEERTENCGGDETVCSLPMCFCLELLTHLNGT